ncbi:MMPL family transporter [Lignipirellula cremea]|nr:MMPL family transporter [Lignipirellula cremea]
MFERLGAFVAKHWLGVILFWIALAVLLRCTAPPWDSVTFDGDFAYMPADFPSVRGEAWLEEAFPYQRAKSSLAIVVAREKQRLDADDEAVALDISRQLMNLLGASLYEQSQATLQEAEKVREVGRVEGAVRDRQARAAALLDRAEDALQSAISMNGELVEYRRRREAERAAESLPLAPPTSRLAEPYHNLALVKRAKGEEEAAREWQAEASQLLTSDAALLASSTPLAATDLSEQPAPLGAGQWPLLDVWTPSDRLLHDKLVSPDGCAMLVVMQLENEFMATDNIALVERIDSFIAPLRQDAARRVAPGLQIEYSGSAAIGGDMLRSTRASIQNTEICTVLLVVLILVVVYRAPVLVIAPLATIAVSLVVSISLVTLLTQLEGTPGFGWWSLKVFTTSKVFIVVILFGAGTDYCLFLIARYREELLRDGDQAKAIARATGGVGNALLASALTTILGLAMMFFADFGKFKYSGPVIGLCLTVALAASLTFTPALLRAFGQYTFWPFGLQPPRESANRFWRFAADHIVARPGVILFGSVALMMPLAVLGAWQGNHVTYDFPAGLPPSLPSRQGSAVLKGHFAVGESGPLTLLIRKQNGAFDSDNGREHIGVLAHSLLLPGVASVRSIADPLGDASSKTPRHFGISPRSLRRVAARKHRLASQFFTPQVTSLQSDIARLEIVLQDDPFSIEAARTLSAIDAQLVHLEGEPDKYWKDSRYAFAGVTAGIRDLRQVTQSDNYRIEWLVVIAVGGVLLVVLRSPVICLYMIASVLFSYLVTIGASDLFFRWAYGPEYQGMDWRVPLFLFVILVAIGEDYNVYLTTRVFEERLRHPPAEALRRAVQQTGGIITSCGVIMAGAFVSMTSGAWAYWLGLSAEQGAAAVPGIVQLGFALSLGVMIDTFVVRPILLPAFLALWYRWSAAEGPVSVGENPVETGADPMV